MKNHIRLFVLTLISVLMIACGGDDNKVNTNTNPTYSPNGFGTGGQFGYSSQQEQQVMEQLKQQLQCPQGPVTYSGSSQLHGTGQRIQDVVFSKPFQSNDHTKICGQFQNGQMTNGSVGQTYVGVSAYNDIMVITEIVNGSQVVGHNVRLSMCGQYAMSYSYGGYGYPQQSQLPLIDNQRPLSNFQTGSNSCIVLDKDNFCPYGVVDYASQTVMTAGPVQTNGMQLQAVPIYTSFAKPTCNGNY